MTDTNDENVGIKRCSSCPKKFPSYKGDVRREIIWRRNWERHVKDLGPMMAAHLMEDVWVDVEALYVRIRQCHQPRYTMWFTLNDMLGVAEVLKRFEVKDSKIKLVSRICGEGKVG